MHNINIIATTHNENGLCNSKELFKIIEYINPEIIFEEFSTDGFDAIYNGNRKDTLESTTIKKYIKKYNISHIPVDINVNKLIDKNLKNDILDLTEIFYQNLDYIELHNQRNFYSKQLGFPYLNNHHCQIIMSDLHALEEEILRRINNSKLYKTYKSWLDINDQRENGMIKNIYNYSTINNYNRAVLLIGAEHRKPLYDKIQKIENNSNYRLIWDFNFFA